MKIKAVWFYLISVFLDIVAIFTFAAGNHHGTGVVWLCVGSCFLCIGGYFSRKEQDTNTSDEPADESESAEADSSEHRES